MTHPLESISSNSHGRVQVRPSLPSARSDIDPHSPWEIRQLEVPATSAWIHGNRTFLTASPSRLIPSRLTSRTCVVCTCFSWEVTRCDRSRQFIPAIALNLRRYCQRTPLTFLALPYNQLPFPLESRPTITKKLISAVSQEASARPHT